MRILRGTFSLALSLAAIAAWNDRASALHAATGADQAPVLLNPYSVKGKPATSFGISFYYEADVRTQRIIRLFILEVVDGSEAAEKGLKTGTEVIAADGTDIRTLDAKFDPKSEFNRLFMNRKAGERITLTILRKEGAKPCTVELTEIPKNSD